ncbi:MAG: hypothetical protein V8R91_21300 [Butyricimonas faecihominis]
MGSFQPLLFSDAIGFANIVIFLLHRLACFSCGVGLIFLSMLLMKRMDDKRSAFRKVLGILAGGFVVLGILAGTLYVKCLPGYKSTTCKIQDCPRKCLKNDGVQVSPTVWCINNPGTG